MNTRAQKILELKYSARKLSKLCREYRFSGVDDEARDESGKWTVGGDSGGMTKSDYLPNSGISSKSEESLEKEKPTVLYHSSGVVGSKYIDMDFGGDWFHVRIADHANKTQNPQSGQGAATKASIKKASKSGMDNAHDLNIVTDSIPESKEEQVELAKKIIIKNLEHFEHWGVIDPEKKKIVGHHGNDLETDGDGNPLD